jgi:hypothetical protein
MQAICGWAVFTLRIQGYNDIKARIQSEIPDKNTPISVVHQTTELRTGLKNAMNF